MIHKVECITISCDNCDADFEDIHTGFSVFVDENGADDYLDNNGWHISEDKHYCPNCHHIDEEDNVVIKPKQS